MVNGDPVEASFAVSLPVQIGDAKTWIEAFVVPGSTPHLISQRWLSQHRCVVNFDPNSLCLQSPQFGSVPLVLHSSGHLLLSLVSPSNPVDQYTVMIDYQNSPSSVVNNFQKCNEQIMDSLQARNQVVDKRAAVITQSGLIEQDLHSNNFRNCSKWFRRGGQRRQG